MEKDVRELQQKLSEHILDSTYYRAGISKEQLETKTSLESLEKKIDELLEVYTSANLLKKFIIGLIGFIGSITAIIYSWLHILKKS